MNRGGRWRRLVMIVVGLLVAGTAIAQAGSAAAETFECNEDYLNNKQAAKILAEEIETLLSNLPSTAPSAVQLTAPSALRSGPTVADSPASPSLLGLAFGSNVLSSSEGVLTLTLKPRPQDEEGVSVALSSGGMGLKFDRDGDGTADEAQKAQDADDIFGWEVRWQFGSRDRQQLRNWSEFSKQTGDGKFLADKAFQSLLRALTQNLSDMGGDTRLAIWNESGGISCRFWRAWLRSPEVLPLVRAVALADKRVQDDVRKALQKIDRKHIITLFAGGVEREPEFGPDELRGGMRAVWNVGEKVSTDLTMNVDWTRRDGLPAFDDAESWRLALGGTWLLGRGETLEDRPGFDLTLAASYEMFDNVPTATHDEVGKVNLKVEIPLSDGLKLPLSLTWANHADLLEEEDELSAHVGFTFNFQDLLKPKKAGS